MNKYLKLLLCLLILAMPVSVSARKSVKLDTVVFETHMHCENCVKKVVANISYLRGVEDLQVSLAEQEITVSYNSGKTNPETLKSEIEKLGYPAKIKLQSAVSDKTE